MSTSSAYKSLNAQLQTHGTGITASEFHGFLFGLLTGGYRNKKWHILVADMLNDGNPLTRKLASQIEKLHKEIESQLSDPNLEFHLLLDDENLHDQIDDLVGWVNYFLLGLGLVQPKIADMKGDIGEIISDLRQITHLVYDENEDQRELAFAFEEIVEYIRIATILCHAEFSQSNITPTIH